MSREPVLVANILRLASELYFDPDKGNFKKVAAARKSAGCVSRCINWIQQLQLTFDIFSTTKEEVDELLPKEFDRFRKTAGVA